MHRPQAGGSDPIGAPMIRHLPIVWLAAGMASVLASSGPAVAEPPATASMPSCGVPLTLSEIGYRSITAPVELITEAL